MNKRPGTGKKQFFRAVLVLAILVFLGLGHYFGRGFGPQSRGLSQESGETTVRAREGKVGRNHIYDRNFNELAVSVPSGSVYVRPLELDDSDAAADELAAVLGRNSDELKTQFKAERSFVWLVKKIAPQLVEKILALKLEGVYTVPSAERFYPQRQTAAHIIGFAKDGYGLAGVEFQYDSLLRQGGGADRDVAGNPAPDDIAAKATADLVLTVDLTLQEKLEQELARLCAHSDASAGMALVLIPATGEMLAGAVYPGFDPNQFWEYSTAILQNRVVEQVIHPAGMGAFFTLAAVIDHTLQWPATVNLKDYANREKQFWYGQDSGVYASYPGLPEFSRNEIGDAAGFAVQLGLTTPTHLDLPASVSPPPGVDLQSVFGLNDSGGPTVDRLVTAFSRLVNNGLGVVPFLGYGEYDAAGQEIRPAARQQPQQILHWQTSELFLAGLAELEGIWNKEALVVESLGPASAERESPPGGENSRQAAGADNSVFQLVSLGAYPVKEPKIVMAVVLDNARIDPRSPSASRVMVKKYLHTAAEWLPHYTIPAIPAQEQKTAGEYFQNWQSIAREDGQSAVVAVEKPVIPDVSGLSLRKALQVLDGYDLDLKIDGYGRVIGQEPAAGSRLETESGVLRLQPDRWQ